MPIDIPCSRCGYRVDSVVGRSDACPECGFAIGDSLVRSFGVVQRLHDRRLMARARMLLTVDACRWAMLLFSGVIVLIVVDLIGVPQWLVWLSADELRRLLLLLLLLPLLVFAVLSLFVAALVGWPQRRWVGALGMHWTLVTLTAFLIPLQLAFAVPLMRVSIGVTSEPPPTEMDRAAAHFALAAGIVLHTRVIKSIAHRMGFVGKGWGSLAMPIAGLIGPAFYVIEASPRWSGSTQQAIDTAHQCNTFLVVGLAAAFAAFELVVLVRLHMARRKLTAEQSTG